jgi:hypothetical protein
MTTTMTTTKKPTELHINVQEGLILRNACAYARRYFRPHMVRTPDGRLHVSFNLGGGRIFVGRPDPALTPEAAAAEKAAIIAATKESIIAKNEY